MKWWCLATSSPTRLLPIAGAMKLSTRPIWRSISFPILNYTPLLVPPLRFWHKQREPRSMDGLRWQVKPWWEYLSSLGGSGTWHTFKLLIRSGAVVFLKWPPTMGLIGQRTCTSSSQLQHIVSCPSSSSRWQLLIASVRTGYAPVFME